MKLALSILILELTILTKYKLTQEANFYIVKTDTGGVKFVTVLILKVSILTHFVSILNPSNLTVKFAALHMMDGHGITKYGIYSLMQIMLAMDKELTN